MRPEIERERIKNILERLEALKRSIDSRGPEELDDGSGIRSRAYDLQSLVGLEMKLTTDIRIASAAVGGSLDRLTRLGDLELLAGREKARAQGLLRNAYRQARQLANALDERLIASALMEETAIRGTAVAGEMIAGVGG